MALLIVTELGSSGRRWMEHGVHRTLGMMIGLHDRLLLRNLLLL